MDLEKQACFRDTKVIEGLHQALWHACDGTSGFAVGMPSPGNLPNAWFMCGQLGADGRSGPMA